MVVGGGAVVVAVGSWCSVVLVDGYGSWWPVVEVDSVVLVDGFGSWWVVVEVDGVVDVVEVYGGGS
jgi:hypothetical protein